MIKIRIIALFILLLYQSTALSMNGFRPAPKTEVNIELLKHLPMLETDRMLLRPVSADDCDALFDLFSNDEITHYMLLETHDSKEATQKYIKTMLQHSCEGKPVPWVCVEKKSTKLIGLGGFSGVDEVGSATLLAALLKQYWDKGLATEALKEIIVFGFRDLRFNRIEGYCVLPNVRSAKVMEAAGMRHEATLRECAYGKGGYWSSKMYAILRSDVLK